MKHLLLLSVLFLVGCGGVQATTQKNKKIVTVPVRATSVTEDQIIDTYQTTANVQASNSADVKARSTGIVTGLYVEEGDYVEAGQVLLQLDVERLSLQERKDRATLAKFKADYDRQSKLFEKELTSLDMLDESRYNYETRLAQYNITKLDLERATVRSPISGIVAIRNIKLGNMAQQGSQLFTIVDMTSLSVDLFLPEKELAVVQRGQDVLLSSDLNELVKGRVDIVSPIIDRDTGMFRARVDIGEANLRPGMFVRVAVITNIIDRATIVDRDAIIKEDEDSFVFVVNEDKAYKRPVTLGINYEDSVQIITGLKAGDQVVNMGQRQLKDGTVITII